MKNIKKLMLGALALCMSLSLCSVRTQASGGNEYSTAQEIRLNQDIYGTLVANQEKDYYKLNVTDSGIYHITGSNNISPDTELAILSSSHSTMRNSTPVWNNNTGNGTWEYDVALSRGLYYITVYEWNDRGDYNFKVTEKASANETIYDTYGDDHEYSTAHDINVGQQINGVLAKGEDKDYYRFVVNDSGIYNISGTTQISSDAKLTVISNTGSTVRSVTPIWNNNTSSGTWNFDVALSQGTYYIEIYEWDDRNLYSFKITEKRSAGETNADHYGDDHQRSTAHNITIGQTINGILAKGEEYDFFRFKVSKAGTYTVKGTSYISSDSQLMVMNENGGSISSVTPTWNNNTNSGTWNTTVSLGTGTYYIRIYEWDDRNLYNFAINPHKNATKNTTLKVPTLNKVEGKKNSLIVKWTKVTSGTNGYQIEYSTDKKFTKKKTKSVNITNKNRASHTIKKLKSKTRYYVRIRSYKKNGKNYTYSKWSKTKNVKTR